MKSEVKIPAARKPMVQWPALMKNTGDPAIKSVIGDGKVVLFTAHQTGTVVQSPSFPEDVGKWSCGWNMDVFEPLPKGSKVTFTA